MNMQTSWRAVEIHVRRWLATLLVALDVPLCIRQVPGARARDPRRCLYLGYVFSARPKTANTLADQNRKYTEIVSARSMYVLNDSPPPWTLCLSWGRGPFTPPSPWLTLRGIGITKRIQYVLAIFSRQWDSPVQLSSVVGAACVCVCACVFALCLCYMTAVPSPRSEALAMICDVCRRWK